MNDQSATKSTTGMLGDALSHVSSLVRKEVDLARAEINENLSRAGLAIGMIVGAGIIALTALNVLAGALVAAVTEAGIDAGWAALIVGAAFALIAYIMMAKGLNDLKLSSLAPSRTVKNVKRDADAVKEAYDAKSESKSAAEIEREIERERAQLKGTIEDIQDRFSVETIVRQVGDQFREHGGDVSRSIARSVKENPLALAVTGVGLAWLIFGGKSNGGSGSDREYWHDLGREPVQSSRGEPAHIRRASSTNRHGNEFPETSSYSTSHRDLPAWARTPSSGSDDSGSSIGERIGDTTAKVKSAAADAGNAVSSKASSARDSLSDTASSAADSASGAWDSAKSGMSDTADAAKRRAEAVRRQIAEGTENLSQEARARVMAARERAIEARDQAERAMRQGADKAADFYGNYPLVAGALAVAVGAAVAGALPRTRIEDENMGAARDDLFREAERIYEEERAKAEKVVKATVDEAVKVAKETKRDLDSGAPGDKSAADAVADKAKAAAGQVANAARQEANKEKLGQPKA